MVLHHGERHHLHALASAERTDDQSNGPAILSESLFSCHRFSVGVTCSVAYIQSRSIWTAVPSIG